MAEKPSIKTPEDRHGLVERLRWSAASTEVCDDLAPYGRLLDEAADEIERLRATIRGVASQMHNLPRSATADYLDRVCRAALTESDHG